MYWNNHLDGRKAQQIQHLIHLLSQAGLLGSTLKPKVDPGSYTVKGVNTEGSINKGRSANKVMDMYCVKCRVKREVNHLTAVTMKTGRSAATGTCTTCGTKVFRIVKKEFADTLVQK